MRIDHPQNTRRQGSLIGSGPSESSKVKRAKGLFFTNLAFFTLLCPVAWLIFQASEESLSNELKIESKQSNEKPPTLLEKAHLKGQMDALSEHPKTMPKFEERWVRKISRKMILRDPIFEGYSEAQIQSLVEEYYKGYSQRFDAYFDTTGARYHGYEYGLQFDPTIHPPLGFEAVKSVLHPHKQRLVERYSMDTTTWLLFIRVFYQGFQQGYYQTKEGTTAEASSPIKVHFGE